MRNKCLILEPHSDDSCLSSAGFLKKYENNYDYYFKMMIASDVKFRHIDKIIPRIDRLLEYEEYTSEFKHSTIVDGEIFDCESTGDTIPLKKYIMEIERVLDMIKPDLVIVQGDSYHQDHHMMYKAFLAAIRPCGGFIPDKIWIAENATYVRQDPTNIELKPNIYCSLTKELIDFKVKLFRDKFKSQIRPSNNYLSGQGIIDWAKYRGIESNQEYAEAFYDYRNII